MDPRASGAPGFAPRMRQPPPAAIRRYRATASGANTIMIPTAQAIAPQTLFPAFSVPVHRNLIASTVIVNGLTCAKSRSAVGIEWTGTNADEMKVSGNTAMNPTELADSGVETSRPTHAKTHEKA